MARRGGKIAKEGVRGISCGGYLPAVACMAVDDENETNFTFQVKLSQLYYTVYPLKGN